MAGFGSWTVVCQPMLMMILTPATESLTSQLSSCRSSWYTASMSIGEGLLSAKMFWLGLYIAIVPGLVHICIGLWWSVSVFCPFLASEPFKGRYRILPSSWADLALSARCYAKHYTWIVALVFPTLTACLFTDKQMSLYEVSQLSKVT